ncbi:MAG: hypothetical protein L6R42_006892 [Xanthoria sp. 1 TBL-2021]|nr:MAG: hypothetical protein L6R42_006892 [Xanthoria sp. 1 TBL-2021]
MILGYVLENVLGFFFALALFILPRSSRNIAEAERQIPRVERVRDVLVQGCSSFYDSAIFLCFSIQIASIVMLSRLDFGVSASGMGDSTAKITWAVSLLTLLPLLYVAYLPQLLQGPVSDKQVARQVSKRKLRFGLFSVCWLLTIYPFYSKMIGYFGPSLIGNGEGQAISNDDWNIIQLVCTANVEDISNRELITMQFFGVTGSLFVSICTLSKFIWLGLHRQHEDSKFVQRIQRYRISIGPKLTTLFLVLLPIFAISQIWTILRLRQYQEGISRNTGNEDIDSQWTFGQIASITVFAPVAVECAFRWVNG